jgi:hypothetical protein
MERRAFADERSVQADAVVDALRGTPLADQRMTSIGGAVVEPHADVSAHGPDSRLGENLDPHLAREVDLGRELIACHADRLDQRLGRQLATFEAVDQDLRVRPGDVDQLPAELVGIVGQRFDLFARERRAEGDVAVGRRVLAIPLDGDGGLHAIDRQHDDLAVRAAADANVRQRARLKTGELRRERVPPGHEILERGLSLRICGDRLDRRRLVGRLDPGERDRGARQHSARFVEHGDQERGVAVGLCGHGGGRRAGEAHHGEESAHPVLR